MRKILLSMVLVGNLFGGNGEITDVNIVSDDYYNINISGTFQENTQIFEMYIDTDSDETSGFTDFLGAEYLVTSGDVFKYIGDGTSDEFDDNWDWLYTLYVDELDIESDNIYLGLDFGWHGLDNINIANYGIKTYSDNWSELDSYTSIDDPEQNDDGDIQYNTKVINDAISIFEHQQEIDNIDDYDQIIKYRYAVYLSEEDWNEYEGGYEFTKRGATLGRIFTTGNTFNNFHNSSDAGKVIKRYKQILEDHGESTDDKDIIILYESELDDDHNEQFLDKTAVQNAIKDEENLNFDNDVKPLVNNSSRVNKIMIAWQEASDDKYFQQAQDEIYAQTTYKPAQEKLVSYDVDMSKLTTLSFLTIINIYVLEGSTGHDDEKGGNDFIDDIFGQDDFDSEQFNNDLDYQLSIVTKFFNHYTSVDGQSITQHRKDTIKKLLEMAEKSYDIAPNLTLDQIFDIYQETNPNKNY